ncbi:AAA domain-containing protein [Thermodesulfovibrio sp. 1176]|uniref:AAA domain-containing protein n=1 Tax=Thermodesulfovibrio sp. 1176 TaxID=3043424 RepID=UPI002482A8E2|nr:AAA domain-containing protein [Thermodesulfovibrio sp. 1176]MDI1472290.1 AAA domain-containing protein [Thermodesulfovibrio sp. 1176]
MKKISNLAKYYRDLLFSLSNQAGRHFIDITAVLRYGLTADLSLFIPTIEEIISNGTISFTIEKTSSDDIDKIVDAADEIEDQEERMDFENSDTPDIEINLENYERKKASAILIAIYRKQQFDPYNREVIVGFPLVSGKTGRKKFCAPLFYYKVHIEFNPLKNILTLVKDFEIPALNFQLIKHIVESDEDVEMIRKEVLPYLYGENFDLKTIEKIIKILSELTEGFRGMSYSQEQVTLSTAMKSRESEGIKVFNTSVIINAKKTNSYLIDDLTQIANIDKINGETVIDAILSMPSEDQDDGIEDHILNTERSPLLFPLLSNERQRSAAIKTERSRLLVIQGPPGTGKSQTIANLICHLVANGKTVLVSSHQNKALEVVTKALPKIDYLAMSLLKGEKESINELTNKIESFHSHISGIDINHLNQLLKRNMAELEKIDYNIKKLQVRFSELKIIERDQHSKYHQYHKIRDYDLIDAHDSIPEGLESVIAFTLVEYRELLQILKKYYSDIERILSSNNSIDTTIESIRHLINVYDWIKENFSADKRDLISFCNQCANPNLDFEKCIHYLRLLSQWVDKHCWNLILALKILSENYNLDLDFQTVKKISVEYEILIDDIISCLEDLILRLKKLSELRIETGLPEYPNSQIIEEAAYNLEVLNQLKNSWWKWHLSIKAKSARKFFVSLNLPKPVYKKQDDILKKLKLWKDHWSLRNEIVKDLKYLIERGIPIKELSPQPSIRELHINVNLAQKYTDAISALNEFPSIQLDTITEIIESRASKISNYEEISLFKEYLGKTITYLETLNVLRKLIESNNHFKDLCYSIFSPIIKVIFQLNSDGQADKIINYLKAIFPYFDDYKKLKTYEQNRLNTLSNTYAKIKEKVFKGEDISALMKPDLVIEAFRLSSYIREDLLKNPDDINEITTKITKLKAEAQQRILRILDISRKMALKKAESNPETLFIINKLRQILKRKRKTHSFVQLRNQIEYKRLLLVFPCWIMSIEDTARIFPLESGLFDYLIIDEASQCNQATALPLSYRAKRMIVVGDSKQMKNPNTQFLSDSVIQLNLTKHSLDNHPKSVFLHGRNSLLDLAIGCQDVSPVFLNEHFRCEPPIIEFSNRHFYNNNLKILTPFRKKRFNPCMEIRLIKGAYDDPDNTKQNIIEAQAVIAELKRMVDSGELIGDKKDERLTVGILSPFRHQASLLQGMMYKMFEQQPHILKDHEMIASTVDGFQGDERDIILYSFRYAPNSKPGSIHVLQREDEHSLGRLNVAFSRARRKVICFISTPIDNFPKGLIRDYLNHVLYVQNSSYNRLCNPNEKEKCQSDFERDVFDALVNRGLEVYAQIPCAGFFIDFVVIDKEGRRIAVECDGEFHYDEYGELREEDYQRQDIIERNGWFVHRISSRKFYSDPQGAIDKLLEDLRKQEADIEITLAEKVHDPFVESTEVYNQQIIQEKEADSKTTTPDANITVEDKIIELLSSEGPMPIWQIAQRIGQPKEDIVPKLEKLLKDELVKFYYSEKNVKVWEAIV